MNTELPPHESATHQSNSSEKPATELPEFDISSLKLNLVEKIILEQKIQLLQMKVRSLNAANEQLENLHSEDLENAERIRGQIEQLIREISEISDEIIQKFSGKPGSDPYVEALNNWLATLS